MRRTAQSVIERMRAEMQAQMARGSSHDRVWRAHPAVATDEQLTLGQRAADHMRSGLGTWTFLFALAGAMLVWIVTSGIGHDPAPFILLNLCLSTLAGVQAAVLLIAAKRSDEVAAATALHTLENTEALKALIEQNTALTQALHDHILVTTGQDTTHADTTESQPPDSAALAQLGRAVARRGRAPGASRRLRI